MLVLEMISRSDAINRMISYKEARFPLSSTSKREQVPLTTSKIMHESPPLDYTDSVGLTLVCLLYTSDAADE